MRGLLTVAILYCRASPTKHLPLGSDFPVEDINPLLGFYAAIARLSPEGTSPHGPGGWCVSLLPSIHI
jgi:predicted amidohydrolase YtcJ